MASLLNVSNKYVEQGQVKSIISDFVQTHAATTQFIGDLFSAETKTAVVESLLECLVAQEGQSWDPEITLKSLTALKILLREKEAAGPIFTGTVRRAHISPLALLQDMPG